MLDDEHGVQQVSVDCRSCIFMYLFYKSSSWLAFCRSKSADSCCNAVLLFAVDFLYFLC